MIVTIALIMKINRDIWYVQTKLMNVDVSLANTDTLELVSYFHFQVKAQIKIKFGDCMHNTTNRPQAYSTRVHVVQAVALSNTDNSYAGFIELRQYFFLFVHN